ncbi:hypothetical protein [Kosmotoga pacifica]|uniref:Uncharacterized protein n=1 Tax=Kosmotoga pacifica TaxID=1330330 RepID=A0A0G2Z5Y5_9BACT|nr:hypothetical protein [Kosmotoga pacifica]AKI97020.1 hypothetical protein IX53_03365 [Kosmotoga pacifica]
MVYVVLGDAMIVFGIFFGLFSGGSAFASVFFGTEESSIVVTLVMAALLFFTGILIQFAGITRNKFFSLSAFVLSLILLILYCTETVMDGLNWWLAPLQELLDSSGKIGWIGNIVGAFVLTAFILLPAVILQLGRKNKAA